MQCGEDIVLNLGEEISFAELYTQPYLGTDFQLVYPGFFDNCFLSFLHWMVYERYASYKNVIKYFVSLDIHDLLIREQKVKDKRLKIKDKKQTLIILPDNWTRANMIVGDSVFGQDSERSQHHDGEVLQLFSTDTQNRKDTHRRTIKKGLASVVIATHSEVFQPFSALKKILFVDPHKRYYHNQQDPRYSLATVVQKMAEIYGAELQEYKFQRTLNAK
ncbi:MAG: hypothetical protein LBG52_05390 [Candidatus Peribacteria bacterium]|nr:hypothetical protein [Candidatus Peribacteria bacterium]